MTDEPAALVVAGFALAISAATFWRSELRGPQVECLPVPGASYVGIERHPHREVGVEQTATEVEVLAVNLSMEIVFVNDGSRPGYVPRIDCELVSPGYNLRRLEVGLADERGFVRHVSESLDAWIDRSTPKRVKISAWFVTDVEHETELRSIISQADDRLRVIVRFSSLESRFVWKRFKPKVLAIRPKVSRDDRVLWSGHAYSKGT